MPWDGHFWPALSLPFPDWDTPTNIQVVTEFVKRGDVDEIFATLLLLLISWRDGDDWWRRSGRPTFIYFLNNFSIPHTPRKKKSLSVKTMSSWICHEWLWFLPSWKIMKRVDKYSDAGYWMDGGTWYLCTQHFFAYLCIAHLEPRWQSALFSDAGLYSTA